MEKMGDCNNCGEIGFIIRCDNCNTKMCRACSEETLDGQIVCINCYKKLNEDWLR
ncbi:MAG: hypothetical protein ACP5N7_01080 [Candidatus Pacearchaeota archaeon]